MAAGQSPDEPLAEARRVESAARARDLELAAKDSIDQLGLLGIRGRIRQGRSPAEALDTLQEHLEHRLLSQPDDVSSLATLASVHRWRARWLTLSGMPAGEIIAQGLERIARARELDPDHPDLGAIAATLQIEQAAATAEPDVRREQAGQALSTLDELLRDDPILRLRYGDALDLARSLVEPRAS